MPYDQFVPFALRIAAVAAVVLAAGACNHADGRGLPPARPDQNESIAVTTTTAPAAVADGPLGSTADPFTPGTGSGMTLVAPWPDGGVIPSALTCAGGDTSPAVKWSGIPEGTVELAVTMTDLSIDGFVHWAAFGIPPAETGFLAGTVPAGVAQAENGFGQIGYGGPCPPPGTTHDYLLTVHALDQQLEMTNGAAGRDVTSAIEASEIDSASVIGTVTR